MKKNMYVAPEVEFVSLETSQDVLTGSFEIADDVHQDDYGIKFPY